MTSLNVLKTGSGRPAGQIDAASRARIAGDLQRLAPGQVRFDRQHQALYSTDASIYQVEPIGVVIPASVDDVRPILRYCDEHGVAVLPRGGGTSLAGQCTNHAVVIDLSAGCRKILRIDQERRLCEVEPGITVDALNRALEATGLFFAPDPATSAQCAIGGCIGNNAAGARSIRYGRTSENVAGVDVLLTSGERTWLEGGAGRRNPVARRLAEQVAGVVTKHGQLIRDRFPKTLRRNAGYGLDLVLKQLDAGVTAEDLDLSGLMCGSEGTLAVTLGARLKLNPITRFKGLAIASFTTLEEAIAVVPEIVATGATAVELLDDVVLEAARGNAECRRYTELLPDADGTAPNAVLYIEYQETGSMEEVEARFQTLRQLLAGVSLMAYKDKGAMLKLWALRKAGEPLLHGLSAHRKPVTVTEDNAVPLENLYRFVAEFKKIVARHGTKAAYYAHASVGVLHIRPLLDLHDSGDLDRLRAIAVEAADLARACGGVMSGEHGDGRIRGPLLERYFGPELMVAFRQVKKIFDPNGILNPGMVVDTGPIESITQNLRVRPEGRDLAFPHVETYFNYDDQEGFGGALEMCNGAGVCRKTAGGGMCPSYRATLDERHATRGRGNALRMAVSGQLFGGSGGKSGPPAWDDPETIATLELCLSCKACKSECPSNVDIARLKAEYTAQRYRASGDIPIKARVFGHVRLLNQIGCIWPGMANWFNSLPPVRALVNCVLGLAWQRTLPPFAESLYRWWGRHEAPAHLAAISKSASSDEHGFCGAGVSPAADPKQAGRLHHKRPTVVLFADCFVTYNEPAIGQAAVRLLESLGYAVELPKVGCCGRSMISTGLLEDAIKAADHNLAVLAPFVADPDVKAIVVCEPSCLSAMTDDWLLLKLKTPMDQRRRLAAKAMMVEDFIERFWAAHPIPPAVSKENPLAGRPIILHGHCHQKAVSSVDTSAAILRRLVGEKLTVLPSGCCGMAGSFGYTADRYAVSMKVGELSLFPPVRSAPANAIIAAPGTSCRHQIRDGTGREAMHPIEVVEGLLVVPSSSKV